MAGVCVGFSLEPLSVAVNKILPSRQIPAVDKSKKFQQIRSSIAAIGLIEPLSITPPMQASACHLLLDGHIRLIALVDLGYTEVPCLIATDDESYTYNNRINRLSSVQEHFMIRRAIERGVSPERLAKAFNVDVALIIKKMNLLDGICAEAAELLKDRVFTAEISRILRKMKPERQVECVELMLSANNLTKVYVEAMLNATPAEMLVAGKKPCRARGMTQEQMAKMEHEMASVQGQYKVVEKTYGQDVLHLVLARGYVTKLLENSAVCRYLRQHYPEFLSEFEAIAKMDALDK